MANSISQGLLLTIPLAPLVGAIVAAIALTLRRRKDSRAMNPSEQVKVTKAQRLRIVKVAPTIEAPSVPKQEGGAA